jgi:ribosomal protein L37E
MEPVDQQGYLGDVVFMNQGIPYIIFKQITDPNGVARIAKSAKKQLLTAIKTAEKLEYQSQKQKQKEFSKTTNRIVKENAHANNKNMINCPRCSSSNPRGSKYCNNCGFRIDKTSAIGGTNVGTSSASMSNTTAAITNTTTPRPSDEHGFLTYKSPSYKMRINYPDNWTKVEEGLSKPIVVAFLSPRGTLGRIGVAITKVTEPKSLSIYTSTC